MWERVSEGGGERGGRERGREGGDGQEGGKMNAEGTESEAKWVAERGVEWVEGVRER